MRTVFCAVLLVTTLGLLSCGPPAAETSGENLPVRISSPVDRGEGMALWETLDRRSSLRAFAETPVELEVLSAVLWAATGFPTHATSGATRTAPSAGATHPLTIFALVGNGSDLEPGLYRYDPAREVLKPMIIRDLRPDVARAALGQEAIAGAPVSVIIAADYDRTTDRYGERGVRYVHMEVGYASQNVHLACAALGLGSVSIGAFDDDELAAILGTDLAPLMIIPLGYSGD